MERRRFLQTAAATAAVAAGTAAAPGGPVHATPAHRPRPRNPHITWTIFSRHLQWLTSQAYAQEHPYETGVLIGEKAAELGYKAVNLTVRRTGHVDPSLVDVRTNLPAMLAGVRSTGTSCSFITTDIVDDVTPVAERGGQPVYVADVLRVARDEGIDLYRWGGFAYQVQSGPDATDPQPFGDEVLAQLDAFRRRVKGLARLNRRYGTTAAYHTHTTNGTNARSVWDLMYILRDADPDELGINLDIGHMTNEGTLTAWRTNVRYAMSHIRSVGLKDTLVERTPSGTVRSVWKPAGTGMVQWREFFQLLLEGGFAGPGETHYEYDVVGLNGQTAVLNTTFWADHAQFASGNLTPAFMTEELKKDLVTYRTHAAAAGWRADQLT
ncbi:MULTISPECIES: sugar phosphate isomerase/epimerase family protein [Mumia]|uniref:Sugar phosphate isomerase/epimerase family protein n=1 Tax=Mumia xiangluensis TaxID=1678900 RepID=A0ABW1QJ38_9ACTN|nr:MULTISPECIES: TIM barrel protein [Mumia]